MSRRFPSRPLPAPTACPVAELAAEYQKIHDTQNEVGHNKLSECVESVCQQDHINLRLDAVETMAAMLPAQSIEGALFQLGLLREMFLAQVSWRARDEADEIEREGMLEADVRSARMFYSIHNFLRQAWQLPAPTAAVWLLSDDYDPFIAEAKLWASVEADRRKEGGAS